MFDTLITEIQALDPNLLLGAIAGFAMISGVFYMLQGVISTVIGWIGSGLSKIFFYNLTVHYSSNSYPKFNYWLKDNMSSARLIRDFKTHKSGKGKQDGLLPGFGKFYIKAKGIPLLIVQRERVEKKNMFEETDIIKIKAVTMRKKGLDKLFTEVDKIDLAEKESVPEVFYNDDGWWSNVGDVRDVMEPPMESAMEFMNDLQRFMDNKELFKQRKLPFKRGYLFYGKPGTGKTSLVLHAASKLGMNIYITTTPLDNLMISNVKPNSIILVEDIDLSTVAKGNHGTKVAPPIRTLLESTLDVDKTQEELDEESMMPVVTPEHEPEEDEPELRAVGTADLQKMLQMLDGITTFENCIFICTTNNIDALDPALIRAGRIDRKYNIDVLTPAEQLKYYNNFYNQTATKIGSTHHITMADLSNLFLTNIESHATPKQTLMIQDDY